MSRKQGDPCPNCKDGILSVHPDTMISDSASHRTWLCDKCGKTCKDLGQTINETLGASENVSFKIKAEGGDLFVKLVNLAFKQNNVTKPKVCSFCQSTEFTISGEGFCKLPLWNPFLIKNNRTLVTVVVGCDNCYYKYEKQLIFINLFRLIITILLSYSNYRYSLCQIFLHIRQFTQFTLMQHLLIASSMKIEVSFNPRTLTIFHYS